MRRTTVLLDDDLADRLDYERRRRNQSTTSIVREALAEYLAGGKAPSGTKRLGFIGLGASRDRDKAGSFEEMLDRDRLRDLMADSFSAPPSDLPRKEQTGSTRRSR